MLEITPEIPEIAGKNTSIPAMIVYLPDNSAGRNYWLLFITYLLVRGKYLTLSTESYAKLSSDSMLTSACCHERHFVSSAVNGSIDYTPIATNCGVRVYRDVTRFAMCFDK